MFEKIKGIGVSLALFVLSQLGAVFVLVQLESGQGFSLMQTLLIASIMGAISWGVLVYAYIKGWVTLSFDWLTRKNLKLLVLSYPMVFGVSILGTLVMQYQGVADMTNQANLDSLFSSIPIFLTIMMAVVSAPIIEETLCRAAIPSLLFPRYPKLGLFIGSMIFAWLHGPEHLGAWIIYGGMGLVFAWLRYKTGRLELCIAGHMLWNGIALLLTFLMPGM